MRGQRKVQKMILNENTMLKKIVTKLITILLIVSLVICNCACNNETKILNTDNIWYGCSSFCVSPVEGYIQNLCVNIYAEGYYYLTVYGQKNDPKKEGPEEYYYLYKIDSEGNCIRNVSLPVKCANLSHQIIANDILYCADPNANLEYHIDVTDGRIIAEEENNTLGFYSINDGYVKMTTSSFIRYSNDGNETGKVDIEIIDNFISFYQRDDKCYFVTDNINHVDFYELDFERNKYRNVLACKASDFLDMYISDDVFFSDKGVYYLDFKSKALIPLTEWNYVDVKPAYKSILYETYLSYGNGRFGKLYAYNDYEIELIIFNNISTDESINRKSIIVGGYGVNSSLAIKWAVYKFNTSQKEYRVYLDDYWYDYSYTSGIEAQSQIAKLIKHFNEGNAPDIYYGTNFDYKYMYNAGLVANMLPIIEKDPDYNLEELLPSIKETIIKSGVCYQIFSAFYFDGDFGLKSNFDDEEITYSKIDALSKIKNTSVRGDMPAAEFADQILRYSLGDLVDRSNERHIVSEDELRDVLDYSVRNGLPYGRMENDIADFDGVHEGKYLTCRNTRFGNIYNVYDVESRLNDSFVYLGFPSIHGAVHAAQPDGLVAISADTKYQDLCWQFIKYMMTDEVQEIEIGQGNNPVIGKVFDDYCKYAAYPELVPDTEIVWKSIVKDKKAVPGWIVSDYKSMVYSIDSIISYDWGLYNIICDEVNSYYLQQKSVDDIAKTLQSRIDLYVSENYK